MNCCKYFGNAVEHEGSLGRREFDAQEAQHDFLHEESEEEQVLCDESLPLQVHHFVTGINFVVGGAADVAPWLDVAEPSLQEQAE